MPDSNQATNSPLRADYALGGAAAVLALVLAPVLEGGYFGDRIVDLLIGASALLALRATRTTRLTASVTFGMVAFCIAGGLVPGAAGIAPLVATRHAVLAAALLVATGVAVRDVFRPGRPTLDTALGVATSYLLLGLAFGLLLVAVDLLAPTSFVGPRGAPVALRSALLQRSLLTLTTVGDPAMLAVGPLARSLSALEAVAGQLFLMLMVARLVGLLIVGRRIESSPPVKPEQRSLRLVRPERERREEVE